MYKKVHKSCDIYGSTGPLQCTICKSRCPNRALYVCDSGHIVCENCQTTEETMEIRKDSGDHLAQQSNKLMKNCSDSMCNRVKDLASGDHDKRDKSTKVKKISKSEHKMKTYNKKLQCEDGIDKVMLRSDVCEKNANNKQNPDLETIVEYKNANYRESKSSLVGFPSDADIGDECNNDLSATYKVCPRPVLCPVVDCGKMIAMDSALLHFYFDHSKIPTMKLNFNKPKQISIKVSNITLKTQCLSIFLLQDKKESYETSTQKVHSNTVLNDAQSPLLLMIVRMQIENLQIVGEKPKILSTRNVETQTEFGFNEESRKKISTIVKETLPNDVCLSKEFDDSEVLLLWICKADDIPNIYNITLLGEDRIRGYSYIGDTIHIRDRQDPLTIYKKAQCLILKGAAATRLLDQQNQILLLVNILE